MAMNPQMSLPRNIVIKKSKDGFGFNIRGQMVEGGQVKSIHGKLYAPLQLVTAVTQDSSAEKAGLCIGDKILQVNGVDVEGATHNHVVDLIKTSQDELRLLVIATAGDEKPIAIRSAQGSTDGRSNDYSERQSLAITIPDYTLSDVNNEKFHVFNIHIAGRHICSRRFRDFDLLNHQLKQKFPDFTFPSIPTKWPFKLSDHQLDTRRRGLEEYLEKICSIRVISDCHLVQEFLSADVYDRYSVSVEVEIKIMLPDRSVTVFKINRYSTADKVYGNVVEKVGLPKECQPYFYLFEIIDFHFERKLRPNEYPHQIYVENCLTTDTTCLCLHKFVFSPNIENQLLKYPLAREYLYRQAVDQLNQHSAISTLDQLEFIKHAQTLTDIYNTIKFPFCPCSSRKDNGNVILSLNSTRLRLLACDENEQVADFDWIHIERYYVCDQGFIFEYKRSTMKTAKAVKLQTLFGQFMYDCFDCIFRELHLTNQIIKD